MTEVTQHGFEAEPDGTAGLTLETSGIPGQRDPAHDVRQMTVSAMVEQAKGVLIHRYGIDASAAHNILERWAEQARVEPALIADTLVTDVCQRADRPRNPADLVRWVAERLQDERPDVASPARGETAPVVVTIDQSYSTLDAVVEAARDAARRGVALELRVDAAEAAAGGEHGGARLMQRLDLALELARAVEPGLVVQLPRDNPFHQG